MRGSVDRMCMWREAEVVCLPSCTCQPETLPMMESSEASVTRGGSTAAQAFMVSAGLDL